MKRHWNFMILKIMLMLFTIIRRLPSKITPRRSFVWELAITLAVELSAIMPRLYIGIARLQSKVMPMGCLL